MIYIIHFVEHSLQRNFTLEKCEREFTAKFILLDYGNVLCNVIAMYLRCTILVTDPSLTLPSRYPTTFQPSHFLLPSFFSTLLSTLLFPRDGEKSTELLIGSVNLDEKGKRDIQVGTEFCRKCQSTVHVDRKDSLRDDSIILQFLSKQR